MVRKNAAEHRDIFLRIQNNKTIIPILFDLWEHLRIWNKNRFGRRDFTQNDFLFYRIANACISIKDQYEIIRERE